MTTGVTTGSWDTIRVSADMDQIHKSFLLLVVRGEGHLPRCSISAESVCCSSAVSSHMLLHETKLVVSISAGILTWVSHTGGYSYTGGRYIGHYVYTNTTCS